MSWRDYPAEKQVRIKIGAIPSTTVTSICQAVNIGHPAHKQAVTLDIDQGLFEFVICLQSDLSSQDLESLLAMISEAREGYNHG